MWLTSIVTRMGTAVLSAVLGMLLKAIGDAIIAYAAQKKTEAINKANRDFLEKAETKEEIDRAAEELARHAGGS